MVKYHGTSSGHFDTRTTIIFFQLDIDIDSFLAIWRRLLPRNFPTRSQVERVISSTAIGRCTTKWWYFCGGGVCYSHGSGLKPSSSSGNKMWYISSHFSFSVRRCLLRLFSSFSCLASKPSPERLVESVFMSQGTTALWWSVSCFSSLKRLKHLPHAGGNRCRRYTCSLRCQSVIDLNRI